MKKLRHTLLFSALLAAANISFAADATMVGGQNVIDAVLMPK